MAPLARELMRGEPITVPATMPFGELLHLFVVAGIGGAPVVDAAGAVLGMVTATDLLRAADEVLDADLDPGESKDPAGRFDTLTARELATPEVVWVAPDASIAHVAQRMREAGIHRVLVGERGRLEGVLTAFDLLGVIS
jgi:CBS domain-containing protein